MNPTTIVLRRPTGVRPGYVDEVMNHPLEVAGDREQKNISQCARRYTPIRASARTHIAAVAPITRTMRRPEFLLCYCAPSIVLRCAAAYSGAKQGLWPAVEEFIEVGLAAHTPNTHTRTHAHTNTHTHTHTGARTHIHPCIHTPHAQAYTHALTHARMHAHKPMTMTIPTRKLTHAHTHTTLCARALTLARAGLRRGRTHTQFSARREPQVSVVC